MMRQTPGMRLHHCSQQQEVISANTAQIMVKCQIIESQNGTDLKAHPVPLPYCGQGCQSPNEADQVDLVKTIK